MVSTSPCEHPGNRLRTMELLDASILSQYSSTFHLSLKSITAFVPYTYKDMKDVDLMEYSALRHFGMLPYITSMGRHCVPSDVFYWGIFNTDASDGRLLITGADGRSNVIGWREVMTAFGGGHSVKDEFWGTEITRSQLLPYKPADFLPETVESDVNEGLGSGKDSEEVIYYREAAPYGPTYYLMTLIAEVFWSNFRGNRFLMPMVYSYLRALHGNRYNWAKAILKTLSSEITFLQNEARAAVNHTRKIVPVVWAPVFEHLLYTFKDRIFAGTAFKDNERWVHWRMMTKKGDISPAELADKFHVPITNLRLIREHCKFKDIDDFPQADLVLEVGKASLKMKEQKGKQEKAVYTSSSNSDDEGMPLAKQRRTANEQGPKVRVVTRKTPTAASPVATVQPVPSLPQGIRTLDDLALVLGEDIRETMQKHYASLFSQLESSAVEAAKHERTKAELVELKRQAFSFKKEMRKEMQSAAALQEQVDHINDEISSLKFSLERAEKQQALARQELAQARIEIRCLQNHNEPTDGPDANH
ncbi:hypothetical protein R1sor_009018 [Riccia sorocarpa]|uniref:Aminotransferase-like plant mobile domain-containing protein n=1 Tax=Riccia sorocarpa TaxID=122646 RepID=A0ABD3H7E6_9MARC